MPTTAGIIAIVGGVFSLIGFIGLIIAGSITSNPAVFNVGIPPLNMSAIFFGLSVIPLIIGIIAILGGVYALQRKKWGLALAGSILLIFTSFILGVLATVFTAISKNEFE